MFVIPFTVNVHGEPSEAKNPSWIKTKRDSSRKIGALDDAALTFSTTRIV